MLEFLSNKMHSAIRSLSGNSKISEKNVEEAIEEIKIALLDADVNLRVVRRFVNSTLEEAKGEKVLKSLNPSQQFVKIVNDKIVELLKGKESNEFILRDPSSVSVILMVGLQGNGKTTTAAKLANKHKKDGRQVLLVAADLVRPAAREQLKVLGRDIGIEVFSPDGINSCVEVAQKSIEYAKKHVYNTVIIDTSGRMNIDEEMMAEIEKISKITNPCEKLLVCDSMIGQSAAKVAEDFNNRVGLTGVILTKFDSDARGGAAMSIASVTGVPIKATGVGEKMADLELFYPERIASRILGMGDVVSLVKEVEKNISDQEGQKLTEKMRSNDFTLADYMNQLDVMNNMGGAKKLLGMIPGLSGLNTDNLDLSELKRGKALIQSMTPKERDNFRIIGPPRKKRIAKGAGLSVGELDRFLKKFEKMRNVMKKATKNKAMLNSFAQKMGLI